MSQPRPQNRINLDIEETRSQGQRFNFSVWFIHLRRSRNNCPRRQKMLFIQVIQWREWDGGHSRHCWAVKALSWFQRNPINLKHKTFLGEAQRRGTVTARAERLSNLYFVGYLTSIWVVWDSGQNPSRAGLQTRDQAVLKPHPPDTPFRAKQQLNTHQTPQTERISRLTVGLERHCWILVEITGD